MAAPTHPTAERPTGVTIVAILAAIIGVLGLLFSVFVIALLMAAGGLFMIIGLVTLIVSIAWLVFAYGAWTLQPWAWMLGVALAAASIVLTLLSVLQGRPDVLSILLNVVVAGVILYYLFQPDVKAALGRT